ncbi:MAG: YbaB/EbfC family nucleoid-associated protein [Candidatus Eisenbacteria bacterium]|nr:YbaB/EbfC family nucleoid-associated protein [Candidatus Eisenbacteria bacterium]
MAANMAKMLKEAQKLEKKFAEVRESLAEMKVEGTAGGGVVRVEMNGQRDVLAVKVEAEAVEGGDVDMLEDLLLSALRDAKQKSDELAASEMSKVTGGMVPPGLG